eukprot:TRINITY_DN1237_c0_g1_i2.p1 TRINITY_DN1237_c0_g1~~TRINITY_DN1237_c0_g1_i2.p1  ORF type:complete len:450 (+),score=123.53 TRINITY_DN1237_c0_g1_i2:74-1423(+)
MEKEPILSLQNPSIILSSFAKLLNAPTCDITFTFADEIKVKAHRCILSAFSPVFSAMFAHPTKDANTPEVELPEDDSEAFQAMVNFMYTGTISTDLRTMMALALLSHKYSLDDLTKECMKLLLDRISPSNCCKMLLLACNIDEFKEIKQEATSIIASSFEDIVKTPYWLQLDATTIEEFLKSDELCVSSELVVFEALTLWLSAPPSSPSSPSRASLHTDTLMPLIRFLHIPPLNLATSIRHHPLILRSPTSTSLLLDALSLALLNSQNNSQNSNNNNTPNISNNNLNILNPKFSSKARRLKSNKEVMKIIRGNLTTITGWSYSGGKDSIGFSSDRNVSLVGVELCGSKEGSYNAEVRVEEEGGAEVGRKVVSWSGESCVVIWEREVRMVAGREYTVIALMKGPISFYVNGGRASSSCGGVTFTFKESLQNTNGTNMKGGQFYSFLIKEC